MYVSLEKLQRSAQLIDALADIDQPGKLPEIVLPGIAELVECDIVTYNEIPSAPDQPGYYVGYPNGCINPDGLAVFEAHLHEHPLLIHYRAVGPGEPAKISDFLSQQQFHRLGLYSEFFRQIPVEYQMAVSLPDDQDGQLTAIALNRAGRDFSEDDRAVLTALSAPLGNALRRARDRQGASAVLAAAGSDALAALTDREAQVLQLAARGRTNQAIARTFDVSPRTIAKHLEHVYRKLGVTSRAAAVYRTVAVADLPPHAAGVVDHFARELRLLDRAEAAMVDQQRDHVGLGDGVLGVGHGHVAELVELAGQRRCVRLGHQNLDVGQRGGDPGRDLNRRALPQVPDVGLERQAEAGDPRVPEPARGGHDLLGGVRGHMVVDRTRGADQPGQVGRCLDDEPRIHRNAVAADAGTGPQDVHPRLISQTSRPRRWQISDSSLANAMFTSR